MARPSASAAASPAAASSSVSRACQDRNTWLARSASTAESADTVTASTEQPAVNPDRSRTACHMAMNPSTISGALRPLSASRASTALAPA